MHLSSHFWLHVSCVDNVTHLLSAWLTLKTVCLQITGWVYKGPNPKLKKMKFTTKPLSEQASPEVEKNGNILYYYWKILNPTVSCMYCNFTILSIGSGNPCLFLVKIEYMYPLYTRTTINLWCCLGLSILAAIRHLKSRFHILSLMAIHNSQKHSHIHMDAGFECIFECEGSTLRCSFKSKVQIFIPLGTSKRL